MAEEESVDKALEGACPSTRFFLERAWLTKKRAVPGGGRVGWRSGAAGGVGGAGACQGRGQVRVSREGGGEKRSRGRAEGALEGVWGELTRGNRLKGKSPAKKMLPKHLLGGQAAQDVNRPKPNSTSSLYILSTLQNPNQDELVLCIAKALHNKVKVREGESGCVRVLILCRRDIWRGTRRAWRTRSSTSSCTPSTTTRLTSKRQAAFSLFPSLCFVTVVTPQVPTFDLVFDFLNSIFRAERLAPECLVMCLAYMDRLLQSTTIRMHASNWRRLVLSALILASKVWEDQAVWNIDFLSVFPLVSVKVCWSSFSSPLFSLASFFART